MAWAGFWLGLFLCLAVGSLQQSTYDKVNMLRAQNCIKNGGMPTDTINDLTGDMISCNLQWKKK